MDHRSFKIFLFVRTQGETEQEAPYFSQVIVKIIVASTKQEAPVFNVQLFNNLYDTKQNIQTIEYRTRC